MRLTISKLALNTGVVLKRWSTSVYISTVKLQVFRRKILCPDICPKPIVLAVVAGICNESFLDQNISHARFWA